MKYKQIIIHFCVYLTCFSSPYITPSLVRAQLPNPALINSYIQKLDGYGEEYSKAIETLVNIGKPAIPALVQALRSRNVRQMGAAAIIIAKIGETEPSLAIAIFTDALRNNKHEIRFDGAIGLGFMEEKAAPAVPVLIKTLQDSEPSVRGAAVGTLNSIGEASKIAIPTLVKVLQQDAEYSVRYITR